jgi:hypothetical protein
MPLASHSHRPASSLARIAALSLGALTAVCLSGCAAVDSSPLESRLREQESFIADLEGELDKSRKELEVARGDADGLRQQLADAGRDRLVAEQSALLTKAEGIKLNPLLTRGVDTDGSPGDDLVSVLVTPVDGDGELIKLPGAVDIQLLDLALPAGRQELGRWSFDSSQTRAKWHAGFLSAGFLYELPWKVPPPREELTLHVTFTSLDGRKFDTTSPLKIESPKTALARRMRELSETRIAGTPVPNEGSPNTPVPPPVDLPEADGSAPKVTPAGAETPAQGDEPRAAVETSDRFTVDGMPVVR